MIKFEISTITPEEQLANDAMSIVMGYQRRRLGRRQVALLKSMVKFRDYKQWGNTADRRQVLLSLVRRGLVEADLEGFGHGDWWPTPLGAKVVEVMAEEYAANAKWKEVTQVTPD